MANEQWPLTAAATQILLDTPSAEAKRGAEPDKKTAAKLALKELIFRGAYRIEITKKRRRDEIKLIPQKHVEVPKPLQTFHGRVRKRAPGEIKTVMRQAAQAHRNLLDSLEQQVRGEVKKRKLIEARTERRFGLFKKQRWVRTASGDSWADDAFAHVQTLEALPDQGETDPRAAAAAVAAAGAALILVPESLGWVARLRGAEGGDFDFDLGLSGMDFDAFGATDGLLDSVGNLDLGGVDAGVGAVDSALDSVSSSIDSGVSAGADAGGGGDFGGGGGDGGGGGGDGGGGGG